MNSSRIIISVCAVYMVSMIFIGLVVSRRNRNASDFLVAGRKLNTPMTAITLAAVQIGVGIVLSSAAGGYNDGIWPGIYYSLGCGGGLIFAGVVTAKRLRARESYVPLDFFAQRYGDSRGMRFWAWLSNVPSLLGIFTAQMLAAGSILAGFGVPFKAGVLLCAVVVLFYCTIGGLWGVVFTDIVQTAVIMTGIPVFAVVTLMKYLEAGGTFTGLYAVPFIPEGMFSRFVYLVLPFLLSISVSYDAYSKIQAAKDVRTAVRGCIGGGIIVMLAGFLCSTIGAAAKLLFPGVADGIFTVTASGVLPPVLAGVVIAAVLAAAMSSASCIILSLGSSFSRDLYNRVLHPEVDRLDDLPHAKRISQLAVLGGSIAGIFFAFHMTDILDAMIIFNYPYMGSMLVPLLGGLLWSGATRRGAFAAAAAGGIIGVISFLSGIPGPLQGMINTDLALLLAYAVSTVVLIAVSRRDRDKKEKQKAA
ncbi:MAG: sodium:solute symporter family protein [Emergencia sp.]